MLGGAIPILVCSVPSCCVVNPWLNHNFLPLNAQLPVSLALVVRFSGSSVKTVERAMAIGCFQIAPTLRPEDLLVLGLIHGLIRFYGMSARYK